MSTTVLETLQNAQTNFENLGRMGIKHNSIYTIAMEQLKNGLDSLENGKKLNDIIQESMLDDINTGA